MGPSFVRILLYGEWHLVRERERERESRPLECIYCTQNVYLLIIRTFYSIESDTTRRVSYWWFFSPLGLSVVYMLVLIFALFQKYQDIVAALRWLDPSLIGEGPDLTVCRT